MELLGEANLKGKFMEDDDKVCFFFYIEFMCAFLNRMMQTWKGKILLFPCTKS